MNTNSTSSGYQNLSPYVALTGSSVQKVAWPNASTPVFVNQLLSSPSALYVQAEPDLTTGGTFDMHEFIVRVVGKASVVTTATVTVGLYNDSSMTAASGKLIASTGASASITGSATAQALFSLEARLLWDSATLTLQGFQQGFVGSSAGTATIVAPTALTTQTLVPAATALVFSVGVTYSVTNTGSNVVISEISVERV